MVPVNTNSDYESAEVGIEQYKLKSGGTSYRVRYRDSTGKNRSKSFPNIGKARMELSRIRLRNERGETLDPPEKFKPITFEDFVADYWLPHSKARKARSTWERDKQLYNKHVSRNPRCVFPYMLITAIRPTHIEDWVQERKQNGVGDATLQRLLIIISTVFQLAIFREDETGLTRNPTKPIDKPRGKRDRAVRTYPLVAAELVCFELQRGSLRIGRSSDINQGRGPEAMAQRRKRAADQALQDRVFMSLMLNLGCRPGEGIGLKWSDIQGKEIIIDKSVDKDGLTAPKNKKSRVVPINSLLQDDLNLIKHIRKPRQEFILATDDGGHWTYYDKRNWAKRHFKPAIKRVCEIWPMFHHEFDSVLGDIPDHLPGFEDARPYDIGRHTNSALMLQAGTPLIALASMQGHSVQTLSSVYAHEIDQVSRGKTIPDADQHRRDARDLINRFYKAHPNPLDEFEHPDNERK